VERRVLIYSHDTFGLGHLRRCRELAGAIVRASPETTVLLLSGSPVASSFDFPPGVFVVGLPAVVKLSNGDYVSRKPGEGLMRTIGLRAQLIAQTVESFRPDALIVDKEPWGLRNELAGALEKAKAKGAKLILGLRDILDDPETLRVEWERKRALPALRDLYDEIWIYGLKSIYDPLDGLAIPADVAAKTVFTGYLRRAIPRVEAPHATPFLLVTTGGGGDGDGLIGLTLSAYERAGKELLPALLVHGPFMDSRARAAFEERAAAIPNVTTLSFDAYLETRLAAAKGIVAMGGYNTFCEILSAEKPALIVPRTAPRREQAIRAERAEALGLAKMLLPPESGADDAMIAALKRLPTQEKPALHRFPGILNGLGVVTQRLAALLGAMP
jgi:predicted glycosyltransferase